LWTSRCRIAFLAADNPQRPLRFPAKEQAMHFGKAAAVTAATVTCAAALVLVPLATGALAAHAVQSAGTTQAADTDQGAAQPDATAIEYGL
jgi:hypothetical protein